MPRITAKIDLGHLLTIGAMLIAGAVAFGNLSAKLDYVKQEVARIQDLNDRLIRLEATVHQGDRARR